MLKKILCVDMSDCHKAPFMAAVLAWYLKNAGHTDVIVESAGIGPHDSMEADQIAARQLVLIGKMVGIDLSGHERRHIRETDLGSYDLIICDTYEVRKIVRQHPTLTLGTIFYTAEVNDTWMEFLDHNYIPTAGQIMGAMLQVVTHHFPNPPAAKA